MIYPLGLTKEFNIIIPNEYNMLEEIKIGDVDVVLESYASYTSSYVYKYRKLSGIKGRYRTMNKCIDVVQCITDNPGDFRVEWLDIHSVLPEITDLIDHKLKNYNRIIEITSQFITYTIVQINKNIQTVRAAHDHYINAAPANDGEYPQIHEGTCDKLEQLYNRINQLKRAIAQARKKYVLYKSYRDRIYDIKNIIHNNNNHVSRIPRSDAPNITMSMPVVTPDQLKQYNLYDSGGKPTPKQVEHIIRLLITIADYSEDCDNQKIPIQNQHLYLHKDLKSRSAWKKCDKLVKYTGTTPHDIFQYIRTHWLKTSKCSVLGDKYIEDILGFKDNGSKTDYKAGLQLSKNLTALGTMFVVRIENLRMLYKGKS